MHVHLHPHLAAREVRKLPAVQAVHGGDRCFLIGEGDEAVAPAIAGVGGIPDEFHREYLQQQGRAEGGREAVLDQAVLDQAVIAGCRSRCCVFTKGAT